MPLPLALRPPPERRFLVGLVVLFWASVAWSAVRPHQLEDYLLEIATPIAGFIALAATFRWFRFTWLSYGLMFCEAIILVVGAHYTHERVPLFDWLRDALHWQRNHYDRFAHFAVGFFMVIPAREVLLRATPLRGGWLQALSAVCLVAFSAFYEITEWWIAIAASPETGAAYLGAQGDPWDAQKDMLLDGLGAVAGLLVFTRLHEASLRSMGTSSVDSRSTPVADSG